MAEIRQAVHGSLQMDWLKPFMSRRRCADGDILFQQGDPANEMFFTLTDRFRLRELNMELGAGEVVGELGLLAPENRRSQTLECVESGEALTITYDQVRQLFFRTRSLDSISTPDHGAAFQNIGRLQKEMAMLRRNAGTSA